jgi:hypothetical protein
MATALSIFFNLIRLILIKVKINIQPFSFKTLYTFLILLTLFGFSLYIPLIGNLYFDIAWKTFFVFVILTSLSLALKLSEYINKIFNDMRNRIII